MSKYEVNLEWAPREAVIETKVITFEEILKMDIDDIHSIIEPYREWMMGGKYSEWRYYKDRDGNIILERR